MAAETLGTQRSGEQFTRHALEPQLRATLDVIPAYTWYANPLGGLTFVNERLSDYLGLPKGHPLRLGVDTGAEWDSHIPLLHPDDHEEARRVWSTCLRTGSAGEVTFRVRNAEGGYRWFLSRAEPLRASDGTLLYWIGVNLEIDERKQAEFYLSEGQRLAHMGSWVFNPTGLFSHWSRELFHIYGLDPAQGPPSLEKYLACVYPQDREFMRSLIKRMIAEASGCDVTKRIVPLNGEVRYVRCVGAPVVEDGVLQRIVGTAIDVTEHELLAQELRRREAYLAEAQRLSHTGSFGWSVSSGEIFWSEETSQIFEYDRGTKPTVDLVLQRVHPEDRVLVQQTIERASEDAKDFDFEHRLLMPDGSIKHLRVVAHALSDESGSTEFVGAVMDITVAKQAEDRIRLIINTVPGLLWSARPDGWVDFINQRWLDYTGMKLEQALGWGWVPAYHPDELDQVLIEWRAAVAEGKPLEIETRLRRFDGEYRWFLERVFPLFDRTGHILGWYGSDIDIHERKHAEAKIREQEIELRHILDLAPQLVAVFGPGQERLYANRILLDYLGLTLEEWRHKFDSSVPSYSSEFLHPDDWERVTGHSARALFHGLAFELEMRLRKSDGSYRWFLARYNPLRDEQGQITRWYVTGTDIEDRKQAEDTLRRENVVLREEIDKASMFEEIVGSSSVLQAVLSRVSKVAPTDSTVLIIGETGTGKELIARAIHRRSQRSSRAFVSVNCAAIPRDLIASELFGHEKGSFTGATQQRLGRFELAGGGTIFLDEVGELPSETQIALLRVLQEREFERVGGNRSIQTDVRVIAATNRDLQAAINAGVFRSDLFYRLNVFPVDIPALRQRTEDIPLLVEYFIDRFARKARKNIRRVNKKTMQLLQSYPWPGNIRELQNVIERSVIVCDSEIFSVDESWLSRKPLDDQPSKDPLDLSRALATQEKQMIEAALRECGGRVYGPSGAAARLRMPRSTLESKIRSLRINKSRFKM